MNERQSHGGTSAPAGRAWNDPRVRGVAYQVLVLGGVILLAAYLTSNTLANLARQNIATGFGFLGREAAFGISESVIEYSPADPYVRAIAVGLMNTIKIAVTGIVLATVIGTILGIARLSSNWLIARLATIYLEAVRNVPVLMQLFFWYALIGQALPSPRQALNPMPGVFLSNRGFVFAVPVIEPVHAWVGAAFLVAVAAAVAVARWAKRRQDLTGAVFPTGRTVLALLLGLPAVAFLALGAPLEMDVPHLAGFNFQGGGTFTPEFAALLTGLTVYTSAFIGEVVRGGILAVSYGQTEAALALGLRRALVLRLVLIPQALRVIVPPVTSQYLNLTKNSSLAVAIGYPDLVSVANTTMNQTGQAIEGISIIMAVYLTVSLGISAFMNWYNKKIALVER